MAPSLLLFPVLVFVLLVIGVVVTLAVRGADIAQARLNQRYARLELRSQERAKHIRVDRHLWETAQAQAEREQQQRHNQRRQALNAWHWEFRALEVGEK